MRFKYISRFTIPIFITIYLHFILFHPPAKSLRLFGREFNIWPFPSKKKDSAEGFGQSSIIYHRPKYDYNRNRLHHRRGKQKAKKETDNIQTGSEIKPSRVRRMRTKMQGYIDEMKKAMFKGALMKDQQILGILSLSALLQSFFVTGTNLWFLTSFVQARTRSTTTTPAATATGPVTTIAA